MSAKWRPPLAAIIAGVLAITLAMPLAAALLMVSSPRVLIDHVGDHPVRDFLALSVVLAFSGIVLFVTTRALARPIRELTDRTRRIAAGDPDALKPLGVNGTRELAEHAEAFLAMAAALKAQNARMARFAVEVSHELRTPLTAIRGAAELLAESGADMPEAQRRRFLENIAADATRMTDLTRGLLRLSGATQPEDRSETCRIAEAAASVGATAIPLHVQAPDGFAVAMPLSALASILTNLVDNAAAHGATRLDVAASAADGLATLVIRDDGRGISPANQARVFDPFFTTRRDNGGTGLGLAIVRALVEAHGGSIALVPSSQGAHFQIALRHA
ncbi:MAG: HAMP domain-containing sensor histidine kinase [Rhizobiaceae bacterium]